jgi:hypothetical protein
MHRLRCLVVIGALAVAVSVVGAGPALAAKGGNNDAANLCQHGGWKALVSDAGGVFVNQGDCVNDGAKGSAPFGAAGKAACSGLQLANGNTPTFILDATHGQWTCTYDINFSSTPPEPPALQTACDTDQGELSTGSLDAGVYQAVCFA